ncbi:MAG: hypothetical protein ACREYF_13570 [Gammaproteobacteria bacterium]
MPDSKIFERTEVSAAAVLALSVAFTGCAATRVQTEWTDPRFTGQSLRGAKVLVVCGANDTAIERICQDQLGAQVAVSGVTVVARPDSDTLTAGQPVNEKTLAAARSAGAKAILSCTVAPEATIVNPGPSVGFGIGGFGGSGGWRSGGGVGGGVGVSVPVGSGQVNTAYTANMALIDVATGRLMWTGKVTTPATRDVNAQIGKLAKTGIEAAQKAGLF